MLVDRKKFTIVLLIMVVCQAVLGQLGTPTVTVQPQCGGMQFISWTSVPGATGYDVARATAAGGPYTYLTSTGDLPEVCGTSDFAPTLQYLTTYYYRVTPKNSSGPGPSPGFGNATTLGPLFSLAITPLGTWNKISWPPLGAADLALEIYRSTSSTGPGVRLDMVDFGSTSYVDKTAVPGTTCYYRLFSWNRGWISGPFKSGGSTGTLPVPVQIVPNPQNGILPNALILPAWMDHTMPLDSSGAPAGGPSAAICVELAHGVASAFAPGVEALNPEGSDFDFSLQYRSALAAGNVASAGLPVGWSHNWDIRLIQDGEQTGWAKTFRVVYPTGASEILTPNLDANGNPLGTFQVPTGAPYRVTGVASTIVGKWDSLTISGNGKARQVFSKASGDNFYRVTAQVDGNDTSTLFFTYSSGKLTSIHNDRTDALAAAIALFYNNTDGILSQVKSYGGTGVTNNTPNFIRNYTVSGGVLTAASKLNVSSPEYSYSYTLINDQPYLSSVASLTPAGGMASAVVNYDVGSGTAEKVTDASSNSRNYSYNVVEGANSTPSAGARKITIKDSAGSIFDEGTVVCDSIGREIASKDRLGATTSIAYGVPTDPSAVSQVQTPLGNPSSAEYDSHGNLTKSTAPYGNYTQYVWEYPEIAPLGRIISIQEFGRDNTSKTPTTYTYYQQGEQNYFSQPTNCGPVGFLKRITFPNGGFLKYTYAANGNVMTVTGIETYTYSYALSGGNTMIGRPTSVTEPLTGITTFGYYANTFREASVNRPLGVSTQVDYNEYGQVKKAYFPGNKSLDIAFGANGRAAGSAVLNTNQGNTTMFTNTYNGESVLSTSKDALNHTETVLPDAVHGINSVANGNAQNMHQFTPNTSQRTVDYRIGNGGNAVGYRTTYNEAGNAISTKQTLPSVADISLTGYRSDDSEMVDHADSSNLSTFAKKFNTQYFYDAFGRVTRSDATGTNSSGADSVVSHQYTYDNEDRVLTDQTLGPSSSKITNTYNSNGTLNTMLVNKGSQYVLYGYSYDTKQRTTGVVAYQSDFNGNQGFGLASASYIYDELDRVTHVWTAYGVTKYVYDSESRIVALFNLRSDSSAPSQYQIPVQIPGGGTDVRAVLSAFTHITYDKLNNRTGMQIALATNSVAGIDPIGLPGAEPPPLTPEASSVDTTHEMLLATEYTTGAVTFAYDDGSRLTAEQWTGGIVGGIPVTYVHGYDNADNLSTLRNSTFSFDLASDLMTTSGYSFNSFGECQTWNNINLNGVSAPISAAAGWDPIGQLTRVSGASGVANSFGSIVTQQMAYDDQGRRTANSVAGYKLFNSGPTNYTDTYTYSGSSLVARSSMGTITLIGGIQYTVGNDFSQANTIYYLNGPTGPVVEFDVNGNKADLTYDPQGSCVASNKGGSLVSSPWMLYDAYGKPVAKHPLMSVDQASRVPLNQPLQYKGQAGYIADAHTGTYYCTHRFYDPNSGRWLSRDPIGLEGGTNTYSYCNGNPVMLVDPDGLDVEIFGFLFTLEGTGDGLATGGSAVLHVFSFGKYSNKWAESQPGYGESVVFATVSREALLQAAGEGAINLAGKGVKFLAATNAGTKLRVATAGAALKGVTKYKSLQGVVLTKAQKLAIIKHPELLGAFKGTQLDKAVKGVVDGSAFFKALGVKSTKAFKFGPDFTIRGADVWWDITKESQWAKHVAKYETQFGKGVIIKYKLK